jgi:F0F1-type ATP synthase delta subunit
MKLTRQHRREARLLWQSVSVDDRPDAGRIRGVVRTMQDKIGRDAEAVLRCFSQRLAVYIRANQVNVVSADQLSPQQQDQLSGMFRESGGVRSDVGFVIDPTVIGGLRVERGYQVTDITIARQLEVLQNLLLKN